MPISQMSKQTALQACEDKAFPSLWGLYCNPYDFPGQWVVRFFDCSGPQAEPTTLYYVGNTKEAVINRLPNPARWKFIPEYDPEHPQIIGVFM